MKKKPYQLTGKVTQKSGQIVPLPVNLDFP